MTLPFQVWCECGHISGHHGVKPPHVCAVDGGCEDECIAFRPEKECDGCGQEICKHGNCECGEVGYCLECWKQRHNELDAEREANWQRNVIGPMFGFHS